DRGIRHVYTDFDHRGTDKNVILACAEFIHDFVLFRLLEFAVHQANAEFWPEKFFLFELFIFLRSGSGSQSFRLFNERENDIGLTPDFHLGADKVPELLFLTSAYDLGLNRHTPRWHLIDLGNIKISMHRQG